MRWGHVVALVAAVSASACVVTAPEAGVSGHYLGYVHLRAAQADDRQAFTATQVDVMGAWIETDGPTGGISNLGAGARRTDRVAVPLDCRLAIVVRDAAEMAAARQLIATLEHDACTIDATGRP